MFVKTVILPDVGVVEAMAYFIFLPEHFRIEGIVPVLCSDAFEHHNPALPGTFVQGKRTILMADFQQVFLCELLCQHPV